MTESEFTVGQCVVGRERGAPIFVLFVAENPRCTRAQCRLGVQAGRKGLWSLLKKWRLCFFSLGPGAHGTANANAPDCVRDSPGCRRRSAAGALPWVLQRSSADAPGHRLAGLSAPIGDSGSQAPSASPSLVPSRPLCSPGKWGTELGGLLGGACTASCGGYILPFLPHCISQGSDA